MLKNYGTIIFTLLFFSTPVWSGEKDTKFGHYAYAQTSTSTLKDAGSYRQTGRVVQLRGAAAEAFIKMRETAQEEGIYIVPISGFRTYAYQERLFKRAIKRYKTAQKASRWVAPPGYSEHHTGWTLDLGNKDTPDTDVEQSFEKTKAFKWLQKNSGKYGFELSFPRDNKQGVNYEPWHWRYVGSTEAKKTFKKQAQ